MYTGSGEPMNGRGGPLSGRPERVTATLSMRIARASRTVRSGVPVLHSGPVERQRVGDTDRVARMAVFASSRRQPRLAEMHEPGRRELDTTVGRLSKRE